MTYIAASTLLLGDAFPRANRNEAPFQVANENEFVVFPNHPLTVSEVLQKPSQLLQRFSGLEISDDTRAKIQDAIVDAIVAVDSLWSRAIVENFMKVSDALGLDLKHPAQAERIEAALMSRLQSDLEATWTDHSDRRIDAVQQSFAAIDAVFSNAHKDAVEGCLYDQFTRELSTGTTVLRQGFDAATLLERTEEKLALSTSPDGDAMAYDQFCSDLADPSVACRKIDSAQDLMRRTETIIRLMTFRMG